MFDAEALPVPDLGLSCKACGYPLAGLMVRRCAECGRPFTMDEHVPTERGGGWPRLIAGGREVTGTAEDKALLERYGIPYMELVDPVRATLGPYGASGVVVWPLAVPREMYLEAVDLVRRVRLGEPMPEPPIGEAAEGEWICGGCGEEVPSGFAVCWNCGEERGANFG